jgi:hypothetical protein
MALPPWFLAAGGAWSVFLAVLVFGLPHVFTSGVAIAIGVCALVMLIATVEQT